MPRPFLAGLGEKMADISDLLHTVHKEKILCFPEHVGCLFLNHFLLASSQVYRKAGNKSCMVLLSLHLTILKVAQAVTITLLLT